MAKHMRKIQLIFLYFLLTSHLGWLYEVFLEVVVYRWGFSDRGVLFGPYCVVYGSGAVVLLAALFPLLKRKICLKRVNITPLLVFIAIVIITTIIELLASYIMEITTGGWLWDYTRFALNFQGRIALNPSLRFGLGGMFFLYILYPLFIKITSHAGNFLISRITAFLGILFAIDCICYIF